jgi:hypothetical protein
VVDETSGVPAADADQRHSGSARPFRRNPFAIALLLVGVLTLVVGVWMIQRSISLTSIVYTPEQQAVIQAEAQLSAPLMTGGVVAIVAWLVLGAFALSARRVD